MPLVVELCDFLLRRRVFFTPGKGSARKNAKKGRRRRSLQKKGSLADFCGFCISKLLEEEHERITEKNCNRQNHKTVWEKYQKIPINLTNPFSRNLLSFYGSGFFNFRLVHHPTLGFFCNPTRQIKWKNNPTQCLRFLTFNVKSATPFLEPS